jgi:UDP-N-acetylglucosamine:LPS N-acetylglucosamine transferase
MRAVALAQVARAHGGRTTFVMASDAVACAIPRGYGFSVEAIAPDLAPDTEAALIAAAAPGEAWAVVDGYALGDRVKVLRRWGLRVCLVDDAPDGMAAGVDADLWIRPGLGLAGTAPNALAGLRYAPLRAELRGARRTAADAGSSGPIRLVVLSGGSDAGGLTGRVLAALAATGDELPPMEVLAILGPAAPMPAPASTASWPDHLALEVVRAPRDLSARLAGATLAITAAGTTALELLCLGVPPLVVTVVDNQVGVAARIAALGAGVDLGTPAELTPRKVGRAIRSVLAARAAFVEAGRALVDGGGARRVVAAIARAARRAAA